MADEIPQTLIMNKELQQITEKADEKILLKSKENLKYYSDTVSKLGKQRQGLAI